MTISPSPAPARLARVLDTRDAVVIGLGSMIGAGVFAAFGPAAGAAGSGVLLALLVAAIVAYANATSSAALAAVYPESGGTYVYGRERLGPIWGFIAGWGFVSGKLASCSAMALTFASYAAPELERPLAVGAVVFLTWVNLRGIQKTAALTRVLLAVVLLSLALVVGAAFFGGTADPERLFPVTGTGGPLGILRAAGFLFFAFAGYARIATLGEEVKDPERTIPRAIPLALVLVLLVYSLVGSSALLAVGGPALASSRAPLEVVVAGGRFSSLSPVVRVGAAVASLGVLLSLIAGVSRTALAMARRRDLPGWLDAVHPRVKVPHHAEIAAGAIVALAVALVDLRSAIGFSSFNVLVYYAIANASAWTLPPEQRRWPRALSAAGIAGCLLVALSLPASSVIAGFAVLGTGVAVRAAIRRLRPRAE